MSTAPDRATTSWSRRTLDINSVGVPCDPLSPSEAPAAIATLERVADREEEPPFFLALADGPERIAFFVDHLEGNRPRVDRPPVLDAHRADGSHVPQSDAHALAEPVVSLERGADVGRVLPHLRSVVEESSAEIPEDREPELGVQSQEPVSTDDARSGVAVAVRQIRIRVGARTRTLALVRSRDRVRVDGHAG